MATTCVTNLSAKCMIAVCFVGILITSGYTQTLSAHRAVYDLLLDSAASTTGISELNGQMVYEFKGSRCQGFSTRFRFVTRIEMSDSTFLLSDQQTENFESGDGKRFSFNEKTYTDNQLTKELKGEAVRSMGKVRVHLTNPEKRDLELSEAMFPTMLSFEILKNAAKGKSFFPAVVYDGDGDGDTPSISSVAIGSQRTQNDKEMPLLYGKAYWPVTITYFDDHTNPEGLPVFQTSFLLYEGGITAQLLMDYGSFKIKGKLRSIEMLPSDTSTNCGKS